LHCLHGRCACVARLTAPRFISCIALQIDWPKWTGVKQIYGEKRFKVGEVKREHASYQQMVQAFVAETREEIQR
jgi:hypothetical protein